MVRGDCEAAAKVQVESFDDKFLHAVGNEKHFPGAKRYMTDAFNTASDADFNRVLIATCEGRVAGICILQFEGDGPFGSGSVDSSGYLGCCPARGIRSLLSTIATTDVPKDECYLDRIGVDASFRGKGIGKALMAASDDMARSRGCRSMTLWVATSNRAKNLYLREGYTILEDVDGCCFTYCPTGYRRFTKMEKQL